MSNIDQRRFDNQRSLFLSAQEAATRLDVKLPTLYAYVSRGLIRSLRAAEGRARRYAADDIERLVARRNARRGHGAVAAGALRWGEPVLDSSITEILEHGHRYRGHEVHSLIRAPRCFESVAELLWTGTLPEHDAPWSVSPALLPRSISSCLPAKTPALDRMAAAVPMLAARDADRYRTDENDELDRARRLIASLALVAGDSPRKAQRQSSVANAIAVGFPARPRGAACAAINRALVVLADHELNVSTFAARVTASAGADLYACVSAALAALSGPRHGGACDRVEALLDQCTTSSPKAVLRQRARRGEALPGFDHPLYPDGDPRARWLLAEASTLAPSGAAVKLGRALVSAVGRRQAPTVDLALVILARTLRMPDGSATALFALGRAAGWIAHAREQRRAGFALRPRARFVGVAESSALRKRP